MSGEIRRQWATETGPGLTPALLDAEIRGCREVVKQGGKHVRKALCKRLVSRLWVGAYEGQVETDYPRSKRPDDWARAGSVHGVLDAFDGKANRYPPTGTATDLVCFYVGHYAIAHGLMGMTGVDA